MTLTRFAVLSDIHGNRWALEAVLADLKNRFVTEVINLGDHLYGPLDPAGTAEILMASSYHNIMGNEDRRIISPSPEGLEHPTIKYVQAALNPEQINWLRKLPFSIQLDTNVLLVHGTAQRDDEYLLTAVGSSGISFRNNDEVADQLPEEKLSLVLCGHDHRVQTLKLDNGTLIHNPGSVGLQAYDDNLPFPHVIENGSPHARYSIVHREERSWKIESIAVSYDWDAAADMAVKNGRDDWAVWLETGRV